MEPKDFIAAVLTGIAEGVSDARTNLEEKKIGRIPKTNYTTLVRIDMDIDGCHTSFQVPLTFS